MNQWVLVIHDPARSWDYLTIGPFDSGDQARLEARRWRREDVQVMVRWLWNADQLREEMEAISRSKT